MNLNREDVLYYAQKLCDAGILEAEPKSYPWSKEKVYYVDRGDNLMFDIHHDKSKCAKINRIVAHAFNSNGFKAKYTKLGRFITVEVECQQKEKEIEEIVNECFKE